MATARLFGITSTGLIAADVKAAVIKFTIASTVPPRRATWLLRRAADELECLAKHEEQADLRRRAALARQELEDEISYE